MLQRLRNRARGQEGFTLIELLVVILIIGILAAVAIPTFLSQTGKAKDANVQSNLNTVQTAESTYNTSSASGGWVNATANIASLENVESTIKNFASAQGGNSALGISGTAPTGQNVSDPNGGGTIAYSATITSASKVAYAITVYTDGGVADTCLAPSASNAGACNLTGSNLYGTWGNGNA